MTRPKVDPMRDRVMGIIKQSGLSKAQIARRSGISVSCLRAWELGRTRNPQNSTLTFALRAAGWERTLRRIGANHG